MNQFGLDENSREIYKAPSPKYIEVNSPAKDVTRLSRFLVSFVDGKNTLSWSIATIFRIYLLAYHIDLIAGVIKLHDFTSRFLVIKELNLIWFALAVSKSAAEVTMLCDMIDRLSISSDHLVVSSLANAKKRELIKEREDKLIESGEFYASLLTCAYVLTALLPFCQVVFWFFYYTFSSDEEIEFVDLPFIMFVYYPDSYKSLNAYFLGQLSTFIFLHITIMHYMLPVFTCVSQTIICIVYEVKLICLRLEHLNDLTVYKNMDVLLRVHTSALIKSHVLLASDIESLNKGINGLAFAYMNVMALQICMSLFCVLEFDDIVIRLKYGFCIVFIFLVMSVCTSFGQKIIDVGDVLRWELYNCPWLEMPNWFKQSLLLMMRRSFRNMELKPYGLYVLDMRYLTNIVNATYTYFNFFLKA